MSDAQVDAVRRRLTTATSSPTGRAAILLSWLGRLPIPAVALWGVGVLVRRLLADLALPDVATAAAETRTGDIGMGVINLVMHSGDDGTLATAIGPTLGQLFPREATPRHPEVMAALRNAAIGALRTQHRRRQPASRPRQHPPPGTARHHLTTLPGPAF